jgi:hypothetical protein
VIVPKTESQDHSFLEGSTHGRKPAAGREAVNVAGGRLKKQGQPYCPKNISLQNASLSLCAKYKIWAREGQIRKRIRQRRVTDLCAKSITDRVLGRGDAGDGGERVLDDLPALDVEAADFSERSSGRVVVSNELGDNSDGLVGVDGQTRAEEVLDTHAERVEIASILVAQTLGSLGTVTTVDTTALYLAGHRADVGSEGGGVLVS